MRTVFSRGLRAALALGPGAQAADVSVAAEFMEKTARAVKVPYCLVLPGDVTADMSREQS